MYQLSFNFKFQNPPKRKWLVFTNSRFYLVTKWSLVHKMNHENGTKDGRKIFDRRWQRKTRELLKREITSQKSNSQRLSDFLSNITNNHLNISNAKSYKSKSLLGNASCDFCSRGELEVFVWMCLYKNLHFNICRVSSFGVCHPPSLNALARICIISSVKNLIKLLMEIC